MLFIHYRVFFALSFSATAIGQASTYFQDFAKAKLSIGFVYRLMSLESDVDALDQSGIKPVRRFIISKLIYQVRLYHCLSLVKILPYQQIGLVTK